MGSHARHRRGTAPAPAPVGPPVVDVMPVAEVVPVTEVVPAPTGRHRAASTPQAAPTAAAVAGPERIASPTHPRHRAAAGRSRHRAAPARAGRRVPLAVPAVAGAAALAVAAAGGVVMTTDVLRGSDGATLASIAGPAPIAPAPALERAARAEVRAAINSRAATSARARARALRDARVAAAAAVRLAALQRACGYDLAAQRETDLNRAQLDNARTIIDVSTRLGLPPRAAVIAIATVLQESYLVNMSGGHLDSAGLFQQRPSAGWGSYAEVTDPVYASRKFYSELTEVPRWRRLPLTMVAQDVQVSAFPWAYARWEGAAAGIVSRVLRVPVDSLNCNPR